MGVSNSQVTTIASDTPAYPALLLRLGLIRARLEARVAVLLVRPRATDDDRRLAVLLFAAVIAVLTFLVSAAVGFSTTANIAITAIGFFAALGIAFVLLFGPDEDKCVADMDEVAGLLPAAKQVWQERRAVAKAKRSRTWAARRQSGAALLKASKQSWTAFWDTRKQSWNAWKQAREAKKQALSLSSNSAVIPLRADSADVVDLVLVNPR